MKAICHRGPELDEATDDALTDVKTMHSSPNVVIRIDETRRTRAGVLGQQALEGGFQFEAFRLGKIV